MKKIWREKDPIPIPEVKQHLHLLFLLLSSPCHLLELYSCPSRQRERCTENNWLKQNNRSIQIHIIFFYGLWKSLSLSFCLTCTLVYVTASDRLVFFLHTYICKDKYPIRLTEKFQLASGLRKENWL